MEEIIDYIAFEIENSGFASKLGAGITITGGGALLRHLRQLMSYKTSMDVNIGYPNRALQTENHEINSPIFSTSIGLLLNGYTIENDKSNEVVKQKLDKSKIKELDEDDEDDEEEEDEEIIEGHNTKKKENMLNKLRQNFYNFFEDKDKGASM